jgi:putative chitinase
MIVEHAKRLQANLGFTAGRGLDGILGRGTYTRLFTRLGAPPATAAAMGLSASVNFPRYEIDIVPVVMAHWLGQCMIESANFRYMREIWGPTETQKGYEGRADLGNTQPGDGYRFLGRSPGMVTGRANYRAAAQEMGIDVEADPALLERPDMGLWAFCIWWENADANRWARGDDAAAVSRLVNRGSAQAKRPANHEQERIAATAKARALVM